MLTGIEICRRINLGDIVIDPFDESAVNPNSVNLRLGPKLLVYRAAHFEVPRQLSPLAPQLQDGTELPCLDMAKDNPTDELVIGPKGLVLIPGVLYLGSTLEWTETRNLIPRLDGRSSIGRLGMTIHITAAYGDIGYCGRWTCEIAVMHPLRVYAGAQICQISYATVIGEIREYTGKYQGAKDAMSSRLYMDNQEAPKREGS